MLKFVANQNLIHIFFLRRGLTISISYADISHWQAKKKKKEKKRTVTNELLAIYFSRHNINLYKRFVLGTPKLLLFFTAEHKLMDLLLP